MGAFFLLVGWWLLIWGILVCPIKILSLNLIKIFYENDEKVIDKINILQATKKCMANAINNIKIKPDIVLIDALDGLEINVEHKSIIKGDALSYSIGAASIVAKVTRDRFMLQMNDIYPEFGFAKHKGYGTAAHIQALKEHGPCDIHRRSFIKFLEK